MATEDSRYVVNYGYAGLGQEWTAEMPEAAARELVDRLRKIPDPPTRLRLLLVVESHDTAS
jgi:hypothetical protein